ncbi:MAG: hypothetical protein ACE5EC_08400 [Phycisphaerae bacterium]
MNSCPPPARPMPTRVRWAILACLGFLGAGCTAADFLFGPLPIGTPSNTDLEIGITIVQPGQPVTTAEGVQTIVQWADITSIEGTVVRVMAQRKNNVDEDVGDPIELVGNTATGAGRDALADGDNDFFVWDITGVRVGTYVITAVIEAPNGATAIARSTDPDRGTNGAIMITTALPVPTLSFTAPGQTDLSITTTGVFDITWTDNGDVNPDALLTLGLDIDDDHENGNEIILVTNQPLSENDDTGQFTFFFQDENGNPVPDGTFTVFAVIDDNANDPVTIESTGKLILNP